MQFPICGRQSNRKIPISYGFLRTTMPTEFHRIMVLTLAGISNTFAFIDDILVVTNGTEEEHMLKVKEVLTRLNEANNSLKLQKCTFAAKSIELVGYKLTQEGAAPINSKVQGISGRRRPQNLKQSRSFPGASFRTLLMKNNEWYWTTEQGNASNKINNKKTTMLNHFNRK